MSSEVGWEFPIDAADQWQGFNDPGIEHFRGNPIGSLAREMIQNSLDAPSGSPVSVSFQLRDVPIKEIPNVDQLKYTIQRCSEAEGNESRKAKEFFATASKLLSGKYIPVLSIIEGNTTGIRGPCRNGTPYFAYMKATGQSKKELQEGDTGLGSYGIGKFAPFAVSNLRTMFVSTVFEDEKGRFKQFTQGKAILTSHIDRVKRTRQNVGYCGIKANCMPWEVRHSELPKWLQRSPKSSALAENLGTSFHVLGFNGVDGWKIN